MIVVKALALIVAGLVMLLMVHHVLRQVEAARVRVRASTRPSSRPAAKLRQDPRTGIYYPED
jgi:hypothetical protein